jgi:hypothetical protein
VGALQGRVHGCERLGRRSERILVRGQLDDFIGIGAQLARRFFDRLPRFVNGEIAQLLVGDIPDG